MEKDMSIHTHTYTHRTLEVNNRKIAGKLQNTWRLKTHFKITYGSKRQSQKKLKTSSN